MALKLSQVGRQSNLEEKCNKKNSMKQIFTIETELEALLKAPVKTGMGKVSVVSDTMQDEVAIDLLESLEPGPQVIQNILNYARSLEILKPATAEPLIFVKN